MAKYTVIIPTRNRARYLASSLASVVTDGRTDVQVLVSDNSDPDQVAAVHEVVAAAQKPVEYIRPDRAPVAMSANWEFALGRAKGEYVTVLGDDDGLVPSMFAILDRVIAETNAPAIRWPTATYFWPDFILPHLRDTLGIVELGTPAHRFTHAWQDGVRVARAVAQYRRSYTDLPMPYNSFIRKDVLARLLEGPLPRIRSISPDVYSGLVFAHHCGRYLTLRCPLSLQGLSAKSNGAANLMATKKSDLVDDFYALNNASGLRVSENLPQTPTGSWAVAECLVRFREAYPEAAARTPMDTHRMVLQAAEQLNALVIDPAEKAAHFDRLIAYCPPLSGRLRSMQSEGKGPVHTVETPPPLGFNGIGITMRPSLAGVTDVAGAAKLVELVLGYDPALFGKPGGRRLRDTVRDFVPPVAWRWATKIKKAVK